ncbi:MAG: Ig-like domain-containing protein [Caldisericia bacterium]|nr:Ig-like domain-containing protein [Caldisericia bacterium]
MKLLLSIVMIFGLVFQPSAPADSSNIWPFSKKCLVELETATWCGYCPVAEKALSELENVYDPAELTIYALHYKDGFSNSYANKRMNEYGSIATPTAIFNGQTYHIGGDPKCKQTYISKIDQQLTQASPFSIRLSGKVEKGFLQLTATVTVWNNLPDVDFKYTFLIGEKEAKGSGDRGYWVLREAKPDAIGTPLKVGQMSVSEYTTTYQVGSSSADNFFASFLIESFYKHNIYQYGTWRSKGIETTSINPKPGSLLDNPPESISFTFDSKITDASNWTFIDGQMNEIEASTKIDNNTVTVTPKKKLENGKSYYFAFKDGNSGIKAGSSRSYSPISTFFDVKASATTPPDPPTPDPPDPETPKPAKLSVEPLGFNLGKIDRDNPPQFQFTIANEGDEALSGTIKSSDEFIKIDPAQFDKVPATIKCTIDTKALEPGKDYRCTILVDSNAGKANIGVNFIIPMKPPVLAFSPESLDFGKEPSKFLSISIANQGEVAMVTKAIPSESWIIVAPDTIENNGEIIVAIDSTQLEPGIHKGFVKLNSSGVRASVEIPVTVEIEKPKEPTIIEMVVGNRLAIVNGNVVELKVPPQIIGGAALVPFRFVAESFNATVDWDAKTKTVTMTFPSKGMSISIQENKPEVIVLDNGVSKTEVLTVPAKNLQGTLCVPIRFFAQVLGAKTDWNKTTRKITITWTP